MRVITVGTGTGVPRLDRRGPCTLIETPGHRMVVDLGLGALHGLLCLGVSHRDVDAVVFTHLHPDHTAEFVSFLFAARYDENPRGRPLSVVGGPGTGRFLEALSGAYGRWIEPAGYRLSVHELAPGDAVELGPWRLRAGRVAHTPSSVAWRAETAGFALGLTGDTGPCPGLDRFLRGVDLLVAEASLPEGEGFEYHLTARQAGDLARGARAGRLVLHHLYPSSDAAEPGRHAAEAFGEKVIVARDGMTVWPP